VLALLASSAGLWSLPFWVILVFCIQFFRDPARVIAGGPKSVLAPADGRIVVVEETDDPYLPLDTRVNVVIGEKVYASSTVLAELA